MESDGKHGRSILVEGTVWPDPEDVGDVEHKLRYGPPPDRGDLLFLSSVCAAYRALAGGHRARQKHARQRSAEGPDWTTAVRASYDRGRAEALTEAQAELDRIHEAALNWQRLAEGREYTMNKLHAELVRIRGGRDGE